MRSSMLKFTADDSKKLADAIAEKSVVSLMASLKEADSEATGGSFEVIFTSGALDRHGETVNPDGWTFENYLNNPVVLFAHDYGSLPIGMVKEIIRDGDKWIAKGVFAPEEANPMAGLVRKLYEGGFLKTVSVGFIPLEMDAEFNSLKQELLEISFVPVPANPEALSLAKTLGLDPEILKAKGVIKAEGDGGEGGEGEGDGGDETTDDGLTLEQEISDIMADCSKRILDATARHAEKSKAVAPVNEKAGRVISEKNRTLIGETADAMRSSVRAIEKGIEALEELLASTGNDNEGDKSVAKGTGTVNVAHVQRTLRIGVKAVEDALRHINLNKQ